MLHIHTANYLHHQTHFNMQFLTRANLTLAAWCRFVGVEFVSETYSLTNWAKLSPWPHAFEFGTYVKFASMKSFLNNPTRGDRYIWFDTDIYPTPKAYEWDPNTLPVNGFWGWWRYGPEWVNNPNHRHQWGKIAWCQKPLKDPHFSVGSGIFSLSRKDLQNFWDWLNQDYSIDDPKWWARHAEKLEATHQYILGLGGVTSHPWMYGLDEHYIEDWVSTSGVVWQEIPSEVHDIPRLNPNAILLHYDGTSKEDYPVPVTPYQKFPL